MHCIKQGERSVSKYFTDMKTLWEELDITYAFDLNIVSIPNSDFRKMGFVKLYKHAYIMSHVMSASTINQPCFTSDVTSKASHHKKMLLLLVISFLSNLRLLLLSFAYLLYMTLLIVGFTHHIGSPPTSPMWMRSFFAVLTC